MVHLGKSLRVWLSRYTGVVRNLGSQADFFRSILKGNFLDCPSIEDSFTRGVCDAAVITLSTGYAIGCLVALVLNGILPADDEEEIPHDECDELIVKVPTMEDTDGKKESSEGSSEPEETA